MWPVSGTRTERRARKADTGIFHGVVGPVDRVAAPAGWRAGCRAMAGGLVRRLDQRRHTMNGRLAAASAVLLGLPVLGCASPPGPECPHDCRALQEEVRELRARVDALDGTSLLVKFPPPEWGEDRLKRILEREVSTGVYRNAEETEFIDNFPAWQQALERRQAAESSPAR